MSIEPADLQRVLAPSFLDGLESRPMEELRSLRGELQQAEDAVSYVRRVVQGRLDIVGAERGRRSGAASGGPGGQGQQHGSIVEDLPGILADPAHSGRASGPGRLPMHIAPGAEADALIAEVDRQVDPTKLTALDSISDSELDGLTDALASIERQLSDQRHALHQRLDALQAEMVRRYRSGEASVDTLLR
jgi:hypothetical protein